ncbi:MAG: flavin-containing monooxygenase [Reyranellaceae bacterium]
MRICIIGAGLSGLVTARILRQQNHSVSVFEKTAEIGGVWRPAARYPGLRTQSPRDCYSFSDFPMPRDYPEFPDGAQVHRYLSAYVEHHGLASHIHRETNVNAVTRTERGWLVRLARADGSQAAEAFDFVVCCNGVFSKPFVPDLPGRAEFEAAGGAALHSSALKSVEALARRDVVVVGFGKSALDIAEAALPVARRTTIVCHRTLWKVPRYLFGVVNAKHFILSRFAELWLPHDTMRGLRRFLHEKLPGAVSGYWKLSELTMGLLLGLRRAELRPPLPLRYSVGNCFGLAPSDNFRALRQGRLGLRQGRLARFDRQGLVLEDGSTVAAQTVVFATGFVQECEFLEAGVRAALFDAAGVPQLYRLLVCPGIPAMAFNGYNGSGASQLTAEIGARWIAAWLRGSLTLPDIATMQAQIRRDLAQWRAVVQARRGLGFYASPFLFSYLDQLLADMGLPPADAGKGFVGRFLTAIEPRDYAEAAGGPSP